MIEEVHFADGQLVKKGDLLFTIDPRPFQAELSRAESVLAGAQARVALTQTNLDRSKKLIETHAIAQSEMDQNSDALLEANASLQAARAAVQTAQLNLNYTAITAPVTGRVSRAEITTGNWVGTGTSAPVLTTLVSVSPVYVEFEVDEQTYLKYSANGAGGNSGLEHIPVAMGLANDEGVSFFRASRIARQPARYLLGHHPGPLCVRQSVGPPHAGTLRQGSHRRSGGRIGHPRR